MQWKRYLPAVVSNAALVIPISLLSVPSRSYAIPAFSRQYHISCTTCHIDFPKLNDFGKAFKDAGFKFPKDDETFLKVPAAVSHFKAPATAVTSRSLIHLESMT
jgi:hypothetical protein